MYTRAAKAGCVLLLAAYLSLVAVGNLTDYGSNFAFVAHVMSMDTTFEGNRGMWRAVESPVLHHVSFAAIIAAQAAAALLCWIGGVRLASRLRNAEDFQHAKRAAIAGVGLSLLVWFGAFLVIANEWFMMWQSSEWNAKTTAFHLTLLTLLILVFLASPDRREDP